MHQDKDDGQFHCHVYDVHIGIDSHLLVSHYTGNVRNLDYADDNRNDGTLVNPVGRHHPLCRNHQLVVDKPKAAGFSNHENDQGYPDVNYQCRIESGVQAFLVSSSQFKCKETGSSTAHRGIQESQHSDDSANQTVDTKIFFSEYLQDNPGCVETHNHSYQHPQIQHYGVFGHPFVVRIL